MLETDLPLKMNTQDFFTYIKTLQGTSWLCVFQKKLSYHKILHFSLCKLLFEIITYDVVALLKGTAPLKVTAVYSKR